MPENKPAASAQPQASRPAQQSPAQSQPKQQPEQPRQGNSGQSQDPGEGLREALQASHKARTEVPGRPGVDARLDNRTGAAAPRLESWPAKPQQVDGPDVAHQNEHTAAVLRDREESVGDLKGMFSPGPHGLSDESLRETESPLYGSESVGEGDVASGAKG
jgi:hypothetical protein